MCRSEQGFAFARAGNPLLLVGLAVELALLGLVVYCPWFHPVFGAAPMVPADWLVPVLAIPAIFGLEEGRKWIVRHSRAGRRSGAVAARK